MWLLGRTGRRKRYDWLTDVNREHIYVIRVLAFAGFMCAAATAQETFRAGAPATANGALERIVTDVPFSAESTTEFVQTAADGSHVKNAISAVVARDSRGRTRYGQNLSPLLPGGLRVLTIIHDPVAGVRYVIDSNKEVVQRQPIRTSPSRPSEGEGGDRGTRALADTGRSAQLFSSQDTAMKIARQLLASMLSARGNAGLDRSIQTEVTPLGDQTLDVVVATGARVRAMIPAGQIGNEKSLVFRSEAWYSHELSIVVMSRVIDPVLGETTFQLTHLRRVEPSSDLFEIPAGYRLTGEGTSSEPRRRAKD
jgi:hypothetical protein